MIVFSSTRSSMSSASSRSGPPPSAPRASRCPSTWRTCATPPAPGRTPCSACRRACPRPPAAPATATSPPSRPACTPPTSRWPTRRPVFAASGRVPQVGEHVHAAPLDLGGLRVLVLVDHVLVDRQVHQPVDGRLLPRLAERGQVLPGVAVEQQLVGDDGVGVLGSATRPSGSGTSGAALARSVLAYTESFERRPDGLTVVQGHRLPPSASSGRRPLEPTVRDAGTARIAPIGGYA